MLNNGNLMVNIKLFIILSTVCVLLGCSTSKMLPAAKAAIEATEASNYDSYMKWRYNDQWVLLNPEVYESQNVYLKLDNAEVIPDSNGKEIIRVWNRMIITKELNSKFSKVGDYYINYDEFDCANHTKKLLEFHLYDGKTNTPILSQKAKENSEKVIPSSNLYLVYKQACEYRKSYLKYQK